MGLQPIASYRTASTRKHDKTKPLATVGGAVDDHGLTGEQQCNLCGNSYGTFRGLQLHRRRKHAEAFHAERAEVPRNAQPTTELELLTIARAEVECSSMPGYINVNIKHLVKDILPYTKDKICQLRKSQRYKRVLEMVLAEPPATPQDRISEPEPVITAEESRGSAEPSSDVDPIAEYRTSMLTYLASLNCSPQVQEMVGAVSNGETEGFRSMLGDWLPAAQEVVRGTRMGQSTNTEDWTKRRLRRHKYKVAQRLYKVDQRELASRVLEDTDLLGVQNHLPKDTLVDFWKGIYETAGVADDRPLGVASPGWNLPHLTTEAVEEGMAKLKDSGAGPDGETRADLRRIKTDDLTAVFNLILVTGVIPQTWKQNRTILIPKVANPTSAAEYRPITVGAMRKRLFHRLLADGIRNNVELLECQRGFERGDGLYANLHLLEGLLKDAKARSFNISVAFLDFRKAFDTVNHASIHRTMARFGLPEYLQHYIRELYATQVTNLFGTSIRPSRGVQQGDPLSPLLFNMVLDEALRSIKSPGYMSNGVEVNSLAYADDVVLVSESIEKLQLALNQFASTAEASGLKLNVGKSATFHWRKVPRERSAYLTGQAMMYDGEALPTLGVNDAYKYLGIKFTPNGKVRNNAELLATYLGRLTKAPLRPGQRLCLLRRFLIPRILHQAVLGRSPGCLLKEMDRKIRAKIRLWCDLPKDAPLGLFHGDVANGGLGVWSLSEVVPVLRAQRTQKLRLLLAKFGFGKAVALPKVQEGVAPSTKFVGRKFNDLITKSCDGVGLAGHLESMRGLTSWITGSERYLLKGAEFIHALKSKWNLLPTPARCLRGGSRAGDRMCEVGCGRVASLGHICQACPRTHDARVERHDEIVKVVSKAFERVGKYEVLVEPRVEVPNVGLRKPDLLLVNGSSIVVVDAQVRTDNACLEVLNREKAAKYAGNSIESAIRRISASKEDTPIVHMPVTTNWRGVWSKTSMTNMLELGLTKTTLELISLKIAKYAHKIWRVWSRRTSRSSRR